MELIESNSSWIIALGKTLLNSLWIGLIVFSLLKVLFLHIPQRFSTFRYRASLLSMLLFTVLTTVLFIHLYSPAQNPAATLPLGELIPEAFPSGIISGSLGSLFLYRIISLVYFAGMGIYLLITISSMGKIRTLKKKAKNITGPWSQLFNNLKTEAGILRKVEFLVSEHVSGPFITGVLKPAILVPASMLIQLSIRELEAILMHEIYHLKKLDHVFNLLQKLVEMLFFFNPAIWLLSRIIRAEREKRCDDLVLAGPTRALDYARALYALSMHDNRLGLKATAATGSGNSELKKRIERILKPNTMKTSYREKINALLLFTCGILLVLLVSSFTSGFSITRHQNEPPELLSQQESSAPMENLEDFNMAVLPLLPSLPDTLTREEKEIIREEVREAMEEAQADIDWDEIMEDFEEARNAAIEDIDWEQIKQDMEEVRLDIIEDIDWEQIKEEMEDLRIEAMEDIDWEQAKMDLEEAKNLALEELNWDEIKKEIEDIDWEQIKIDMTNLRIDMDSILSDFDFDIDKDIDIDMDKDFDADLDIIGNKDSDQDSQ